MPASVLAPEGQPEEGPVTVEGGEARQLMPQPGNSSEAALSNAQFLLVHLKTFLFFSKFIYLKGR